MDEPEEIDNDEENEPVTTYEPSFGDDILKLEHSFGYDCKRLYNLTLIDDDTLVFASGNYIHYFNIPTGEVTFRETTNGAGVGFIIKNNHPDFQGLLTVGENGLQPVVYIYEYPTHDIRIQLNGAAKRSFTCGSYNASGELLATQAGPPDFMLTIWRWENGEVILRSKSFQNDVLFVHFSQHNPILLVSCGLSHIKFWKMANTFTGLKLKGDLGRFGKTDFSDIYAAYMLTDENVISGCEWGNMLLWEAGLIKFEVCRKGRKPCHTKPISRITMENGEVMTVGMDGYVRIWYWDTVDLADPPDDDRFVEIEPIYEFKVSDCEIRCVQKIKPFEEQDYKYYAQDGNGGIWFCDLNIDDVPEEPRKLYSTHGGKVIAGQLSPVSTHLMTLGEDGKIFVFDYASKKTVLEKKFIAIGTDLLWFNLNISSTGLDLVASFEDGILRQLLFDLSNMKKPKLHLVRAIKAHVAPLTKIAVNPKNTILITGSADKTLFLYSITEKQDGLVLLQPMGFIQFDGIPHSLNWKPDEYSTVLVGGKSGEVYKYRLPRRVSSEHTFLSYRITEADNLQTARFVSVKSEIRREIRRALIKRRKEKKRARKLAEIDKLKASNPGLQIDMETALADSEPDEEEEPLHIPAKPNPVLWLRYTNKDTIWVSIGGYDAGYVYEIGFGFKNPVRSTIINDCDDIEIHSYLEIEDYLLFGLINGKIRINHVNENDFTDLRDYRLFNMHDPLRGNIPKMILSYDGKNLVSIGHDGNIFLYEWNGPAVVTGKLIQSITLPILEEGEDIDDEEYPSLEQEKIYAEQKRQEEAAAEHDRKILARISELQVEFNFIERKNRDIPPQLQLTHNEMLLDPRITKQIGDELQAELDDVRDDLAYDLEVAQVGKKKLFDHFLKKLDYMMVTLPGIRSKEVVYSFRLESLGEEFEQIKEEIEERLRQEAAQRKPAQLAAADEGEDSIPEPGVEDFFFGRNPDTIVPRFSKKMLRLLKRYRSRQLYEIERVYEWDKLHRKKPDPNKNHPDDEKNIREAEKNLGDYKLKVGYDYEPKPYENLTYKYIEIVECREKLYNVQKKFNDELLELRQRKKELYDFIAVKRKRLEMVHRLLPEKNRKFLPDIPPISMDIEYPEVNLIEHSKPGCGIEIKDILYLEKNVKEMLPKPPPEPPVPCLTIEEIREIEKYESMRIKDVDFLPSIEIIMEQLHEIPRSTDPGYNECDENGISPWLTRNRFRWIRDKCDEQELILSEVELQIANFDETLVELGHKKLQAKFDEEFLLTYMVAINQELFILRDSEVIENQLLANADEAMRTRNQMQTTINASKRQIDESRKACERLNEQIGIIQLKFLGTTKGHKFFDFLRRIFKKKYRPPKPPKVGDESSESSSEDSSSSEDEEDTKSIDSADMTTIRLDETHCPSGLERTMYDLAFKLRADRHALEQSLLEQQKLIEVKRVEVNDLYKQMKYHEEVYDKEKETLLTFRRKRQQELNKIKMSIVLNMQQIQHFPEGEDYRDLSNAVLFDATKLTKLKGRVDQLNAETLQTKRLHRINIVHLQRMNTDIKFMRYEIVRLEEEIRQAMVKKFGMVVNLDELEEEVLRRYVFELETTAEAEIREIEREMRIQTALLHKLEEELIVETQMNSEKLNVIAVLQDESNFLNEVLSAQERDFEKSLRPIKLNLDRDLEKLTAIDKQQKEQIKCLEREICTLRMKSKPLQMETAKSEEVDVTHEFLPNDDITICPEIIAMEAIPPRMAPDDFTMDRVQKIVLKFLVSHFKGQMKQDLIRKYAYKVGRYLGHAAYNFQGKITDRIMICLIEQLETIMPKKYLMHILSDNLEKLFNEILAVFDYERSEVNTEDVISGIFQSTMDDVAFAVNCLNKTQYILEKMLKELIEVLPLEEFLAEDTLKILVDVLSKEKLIEPKCISTENLVSSVITYARGNLLDTITALPIRRLAENLIKELLKRKNTGQAARCSIGSVSTISISSKKL